MLILGKRLDDPLFAESPLKKDANKNLNVVIEQVLN